MTFGLTQGAMPREFPVEVGRSRPTDFEQNGRSGKTQDFGRFTLKIDFFLFGYWYWSYGRIGTLSIKQGPGERHNSIKTKRAVS